MQVGHARNRRQPGAGYPRLLQGQIADLRQSGQVSDALIRDRTGLNLEVDQVRQVFEMAQPLIADLRATTQIEEPERFDLPNVLHSVVGNAAGVVQQHQLLQLRQLLQVGQASIVDVAAALQTELAKRRHVFEECEAIVGDLRKIEIHVCQRGAIL